MKQYYKTLLLSYRPRTECSISQFCNTKCTHSIFRTIDRRPWCVETWARDTVKWYWSADTLFWQLSIDHNINVQYVCIISFPVLPNWLESMRLNIDRDLVKQLTGRHLDELAHEPEIWSCDTGQWLFCFDSYQLTILWMSNIQDVDLPRHAWDTSPSLLIISLTPPLQSVDAYVRMYARSVTWQPNEKRLTIFHEYGALSQARFARVRAPL